MEAKRNPGKRPPGAAGTGNDALEGAEDALEVLTGICRNARGISGWEIYLEEEQRLAIEAREGEVELLVSARDLGLGLRVIVGGRMGFSFTNDLTGSSLREVAGQALESARLMPENGCSGFVKSRDRALPALEIMDPGLGAVPRRAKVARAMLIESSALGLDPRVKKVRGAEYEEVESRVWIRNSEGTDLSGGATLVSASVQVMAEDRGEAQAAGEVETVHYYDRLDPAGVGERAARLALDLLGARSLRAGTCPVVLAPEAAAGLISVLAPAAGGDAVAKHRSWLAGKRGRKIAGAGVTIVDDGLMAQGPGAFPFDDEGTPCRCVRVVNQGVLENFLYDSYYGRVSGVGSTGNGLRPAYFMPPAVDTTNWVLVPGKQTERELIAQVEDGLWIVELMGLHTADPVAGEFSLGAAGFRIKKGRPAEPLTGIAIADTLEETLPRIEAVADQLKFSGDAGSPAVLIGKMDVSGSEQGRESYGS